MGKKHASQYANFGWLLPLCFQSLKLQRFIVWLMILQGIYIATGKYMIEDKKTRHRNKPNCMSDAVHFSDCDHYSLQIYSR